MHTTEVLLQTGTPGYHSYEPAPYLGSDTPLPSHLRIL